MRNRLFRMSKKVQIQVGLRVKELRERDGVSQEQLAHRIGMDRSYLASIETGSRNVTLESLEKIAGGFEVTLAKFFEGIG